MKVIIEKTFFAVRRIGSEYAKEYYRNWAETFADEIVDEESSILKKATYPSRCYLK